jgi:hypothetical protein
MCAGLSFSVPTEAGATNANTLLGGDRCGRIDPPDPRADSDVLRKLVRVLAGLDATEKFLAKRRLTCRSRVRFMSALIH